MNYTSNVHRSKSKASTVSNNLQASGLRRNAAEPSSSRLAKVEIPDFPPTASKNSRHEQNE